MFSVAFGQMLSQRARRAAAEMRRDRRANKARRERQKAAEETKERQEARMRVSWWFNDGN